MTGSAFPVPQGHPKQRPAGFWKWFAHTRSTAGSRHGADPPEWKPTCADKGATREVVLQIHNPVGQETIYRATDTYPAGSYDGETETTVLCTGDRGFVY